MIYEHAPKNISSDTKIIRIGDETYSDTYRLGLITKPEGDIFFVNFEESDGNVLMYNSKGELLSSNFFAEDEMVKILGDTNSQFKFIHKDLKDNLKYYRNMVSESHSANELKIDVVFLLDREEPHDVFAYFPNEISDREGNRLCYAHVGQHSSCSEEYALECELATPEQYSDLKQELDSRGYNLNVLDALPGMTN